MRTDAQITADIERAYEKLLAEKERRDGEPRLNYPCRTCRWFSLVGDDGFEWIEKFGDDYGTCTNPLIKGFRRYGVKVRTFPMPCGPEKALWQPKLTLCQRIREWFA